MSSNYEASYYLVLSTLLLKSKHSPQYPILEHFSIYECVSKSFRTESITKHRLTFGISRRETTQMVLAAKLTRLTHKIAIQLLLMGESFTICSSRSRRPVRKLLDTPSYVLQLG